MRILLSRTRVGVQQPSYSYRVHVPFSEISPERQSLLSMHSDFGLGVGRLARLGDVIAPMAYLAAPPGLDKHRDGRALDLLAGRVGALLLRAAFPEMLETTIPFRLQVALTPPNAQLFADIFDLAGRQDWLAGQLDVLTAEMLAFALEHDR